jgi:predicted DNA-binding protein (UPF0251 family)
MARPRIQRFCRRVHGDRVFKPQGIPLRVIETTTLTPDQFEALRLCDSDGLDQEKAGELMGVSRGTVQRLLYTARRALVEAILHNHAIIINPEGNEVNYVDMPAHQRQCRTRRYRQ